MDLFKGMKNHCPRLCILPPLLSGVVCQESWIHFPSFLLLHVLDILIFGLKL